MLAAAGPGSLALAQDRVIVDKVTEADAVVLGLFGKRSGEPCGNEAYAVTADPVTVGEMIPSAACPSEATLFAKGHALSTTNLEWSTGDDENPLPMGQPLREIKVDVYLVASDSRGEAWARSDLLRARTVFDNNRAGLTFVEGNFRTSSSLTPAEVDVIGNDCTQADALKLSSLYADDRINVYFVDAIGGDRGETPRGFNCFETGRAGNVDGAPNIIYISMHRHTPTTLAHELGHAFGLRGSAGHTGAGPDEISEEEAYIPGFESTNIMWTGVDADKARAKKHFSLGQVFRMSADERSWLNRNAQSSGGPTARRCHPSGVDNERPCPPLAFDFSKKSP
jgi:hypothetical protein